MKSYELKATRENIFETLLRDTLGRNKDVFAFADILNSLEDSCSIAIDGSWGSGKTFFVNQVKMFLDANNSDIASMDEDDQLAIISAWKRIYQDREPEYQPHVSVYYDAWENDNDEDPVLSLSKNGIFLLFAPIKRLLAISLNVCYTIINEAFKGGRVCHYKSFDKT